jgi:hypothetical protein
LSCWVGHVVPCYKGVVLLGGDREGARALRWIIWHIYKLFERTKNSQRWEMRWCFVCFGWGIIFGFCWVG